MASCFAVLYSSTPKLVRFIYNRQRNFNPYYKAKQRDSFVDRVLLYALLFFPPTASKNALLLLHMKCIHTYMYWLHSIILFKLEKHHTDKHANTQI